jgi:hypothetical protein
MNLAKARRSSSSSSAVVALGGSLDGGLAVQLAQLRPERATQSLGIAISIDSRL